MSFDEGRVYLCRKNINCMSSSVKVVDTVQMSNLYFKD